MNFLNGYKSYITGGIMIAIGVAELLGIDIVADVTQSSAINYILAGFSLISVKSAIAKV
jgi:hypothetical protein